MDYIQLALAHLLYGEAALPSIGELEKLLAEKSMAEHVRTQSWQRQDDSYDRACGYSARGAFCPARICLCA